MLDKDVSILVQVAFKEASAKFPTFDIAREDGGDAADFEATFTYLTESLVSAVKANIEAHATSTNVPKGTAQPPRQGASASRSAEAALAAELGATELPFQVEIRKSTGAPAPAWLAAACEKVGCTSVWDNRDQLTENPGRPWFRAADGTKVWNEKKGEEEIASFWPPRKAGGAKKGGARRAVSGGALAKAADQANIYGDEEPF